MRMITYLPYPHIPLTASCLHTTELGSARQSALAILRAIVTPDDPRNHVSIHKSPCKWMWQEFPQKLASYALTLNMEWMSRGNEDKLTEEIATLQKQIYRHPSIPNPDAEPWWWMLPAISRTHQSLLMAVRRDWYSAFWDTPSNYPTFWPVGPKLEALPF